MKNKTNIKREGFTLVELLIVIVVIGILSAMMMLSSTEAVSSARASTIISNLRNLKTATLAYYVDNLDKYTSNDNPPASKDVFAYMSNGSQLDSYAGYDVKVNTSNNNAWYVTYNVSDSRIKEKLQGRSKSVGLTKGAESADYDGKDDSVGMFVR